MLSGIGALVGSGYVRKNQHMLNIQQMMPVVKDVNLGRAAFRAATDPTGAISPGFAPV